jgi:SM-20-related protein
VTGAATADAAPALVAVVESIAKRGYALAYDFIAPREVAALSARLDALDAAGLMRPAAIGRGATHATRDDIRGDRIHWLDERATDAAERPLLAALDALRLCANRELQLGLFDVESHYAIYPPGGGYARHVDRFRDSDARVLSFVLYLNADWSADDGGALALDTGAGHDIEIVPHAGTLVAFLSERIAHEVRPARRARRSLAGWFRRRA